MYAVDPVKGLPTPIYEPHTTKASNPSGKDALSVRSKMSAGIEMKHRAISLSRQQLPR